MFTAEDHTFVICAYGDSPFLQDCVSSLLNQSKKSEVLISTSTPSDFIDSIAKKNGLQVCINSGKSGIAGDWNAAIACAGTSLVTIAHQDDVYDSNYCARVISGANQSEFPLIIFTDYGEIRGGEIVTNSPILKAKRRLLVPLKSPFLRGCRVFKRLSLSFGNPICCPSVTYNLNRLQVPLFEEGFRSNLDWGAWERFSRQPGAFVYLDFTGMFHRIHGGSETSGCIQDNVRCSEDLTMLERFWPKPIAILINKVYSMAQAYN